MRDDRDDDLGGFQHVIGPEQLAVVTCQLRVKPSGLAARASAFVLDAVLILLVTFGVAGLGRSGDVYIPIELTFLLAWALYATLATAWQGRTLGKWALGLAVQARTGGPPGAISVVVRELPAKLLATLPLGLGLWWIGLRRTKRGWHDYFAGTRVVQELPMARRRWLMALVVLGLLLGLGPPVVERVQLFIQGTRLTPRAARPVATPATPPHDVQTISPTDHPALLRWLDAHAQPPEEYAVTVTARHQLTIYGEYHHVRDNLLFLQRLIPDLYHRAGVACIAMEALVWDDNAALERLVSADLFDRAQAVALARYEGWKSWGSREYLDVLEAVWRVNRSLPADKPRLRVIGLDREWDLPSWALVGVGDDSRPGSWWERLRLARVLPELPLMAKRDELMAWQLEQEVFAKGQRAIAWVGAAHAYTDYTRPMLSGDPGGPRRYRMGAILRQRHGDRICHLRLHDSTLGGPALAALIETLQAARGHQPVGFNLAGSPFADLRDDGGFEYRLDPKARFADFALGYLYLKPLHSQQHCTLEPGFVTRAMFLRDKPYYEARIGGSLRDAAEANELFAQQWAK